MDIEAARLVARVDTDTSKAKRGLTDFDSTLKSWVIKTKGRLDEFANNVKSHPIESVRKLASSFTELGSTAEGGFGRITAAARSLASGAGSALSSLAEHAVSVGRKVSAVAVVTGAAVAGLVAKGISKVATTGFSLNNQLETATLQFATLMKRQDETIEQATVRAQQHVKDLFEFAKVTPYETTEVINASRMLQTFGKDALNTKENLYLIGDAAAAVSAPIGEVSFWVGRAYTAMKGGRPFGEASARLMELGLMSGDTRNALEKLQKSGASGDKVWAAFTASLKGYSGAMARQATTWSGLSSTLKDAVGLSMADASKSVFEAIKGITTGLIDFTTSPVWAKFMDMFKTLFDNAKPYADKIEGLLSKLGSKENADNIDKIADAFKKIKDNLGPALLPLAVFVGAAGLGAIAGVLPFIGALLPTINPFLAALFAIGIQSGDVRDTFKDMFDRIKKGTGGGSGLQKFGENLSKTLGTVVKGIQSVIAGIVELGAPIVVGIIDGVAKAFDVLFGGSQQEQLGKFQGGVQGIVDKLKPFAERLGELIDKYLPVVVEWLKEKIPVAIQKTRDFFVRAKDKIVDTWKTLKEKVGEYIDNIKDKFDEIKERWDKFYERIKPDIDAIKENFKDLSTQISEWWRLVSPYMDDFVRIIGVIIGIAVILSIKFLELVTWSAKVTATADVALTKVGQFIGRYISEVIGAFDRSKDEIAKFVGWVGDFFNADTEMFSAISRFGSKIFEALGSGMSSAWSGVASFLKESVGKVLEAFGWFFSNVPALHGLGQSLTDAGRSLGGSAKYTPTSGYKDSGSTNSVEMNFNFNAPMSPEQKSSAKKAVAPIAGAVTNSVRRI